jgi:hypothetical protein
MKKNNDYADRIIEELRDPDDNVLDYWKVELVMKLKE